MPNLAEELRRILTANLQSITTLIDDLRGRLQPSQRGLRTALDLAAHYPEAAQTAADAEWDHFVDDDSRIDLVRRYLRHANATTELIEEWFARGGIEEAPPSLTHAIERECDQLLTADRFAVVTIGPADNFETIVGDLFGEIFSGLGGRAPSPPADLLTQPLAMVQVPRIEGRAALWLPIVLGHELAHLAVVERDGLDRFDLDGKFDPVRASTFSAPDYDPDLGPAAFAIYTTAEAWIEELLCDAYAVRRFGPAAIASLCAFLELAGAIESCTSHPPGWFRARMMLVWAGALGEPRLDAVLEPWREMAEADYPVPDWAGYLIEILEPAADEFMAAIHDWPATYDAAARAPRAIWVADRLHRNLPSARTLDALSEGLRPADVINGGWIASCEACPTPVESLTAHSLECLAFETEIDEAAATVGVTLPALPALDALPDVGPGATLSAQGILARMTAENPDDQLSVTPLLPTKFTGAAIDVRLGKRFIVFQRSAVGAFEPLGKVSDPRSMQRGVERAWGEHFVLHPGELVLAATLEYLGLPGDLSGQVITRSSYGRLGLITATAILVHPNFHGCLTLELVNLGAMPITLTPGERIAQIAVHTVTPRVEPTPGKYESPTGPEFSKVRTDDDAKVLRELRGLTDA